MPISAAACSPEFVGTALFVVLGAGTLLAALEMGHGQLDDAGLGSSRSRSRSVVPAVLYRFRTTRRRTSTATVPWRELWIYCAGRLVGGAAADL